MDVNIIQYPQGVAAQLVDRIYGLKAEWTTLVLLQQPVPDPRLFSIAHLLRRTLQIQNFSLEPSIKRNWSRRLRWAATLLEDNNPKVSLLSRIKRAPLEFVGTLSHWLFGTVTEKQLAVYQKAVRLALTSNNHTIHVVNDLITVTKRTQIQLTAVQHRISSLDSYVRNFSASLSQHLQTIQSYMQQISFQMNYEHLLVSLEQAISHFARQMDLYSTQKRSLEIQQLTEDILPPKVLGTIIKQASQQQYFAPHPSWYYSHVRIVPIWTNKQALLFKAVLPFHDGAEYLRYSLQSFPLPLALGLYSQFQLVSDVSLHTELGSILTTKTCTGAAPPICHTGALWARSQYLCERAIINQEETLRNQCKVKLFHAQEPLLYEQDSGRYILSTQQLVAYQNCKGQPEKKNTLKAGVYSIKIADSCSLKSKNWTLKGIHHAQETYNLTLLPIIVDLVSPLQQHVPLLDPKTLQQLPEWNTVDQILAINISKLPSLPIT